MSGITELDELLRAMSPKLLDSEFVFCTVKGKLNDYVELDPVATFIESEGLTLVAAYYHDHVFVQTSKAGEALSALQEFSA